MDEKLRKAILKTLSYSDIFDYPLRISELRQYLIGFRVNDPLTLSSLFDAERRGSARGGLKNARIGERNGYFFLQGREKIVALRREREKISDEKMQRAKKVLHILEHIPFIKMVAVTGAVAAGNAEKDSDIDVLIVAQKNRLWLARLMAILLMELKGTRRRPGSTSLKKDKFCLNMFISEDNLELPNKDLFTANEFVRMKVVWEKDGAYERFVKANGWVKAFLPNWKPTKEQRAKSKEQKYKSKFKNFLSLLCNFTFCSLIFDFWESVARTVQLKYMERRKTTELVTNGLLMFHPNDAREWVMREYKKRLKELAN